MSLRLVSEQPHMGTFDSARHSDIHALRPVSTAELRTRYLALTAEHLLAGAEPLFGPGKYEIVFDFVVNHILMPPDRAGRDHALEVLYQKMKGVTLLGFSQNLGESIELVRLAKELDDGLVAILAARHYASTDQIDSDEINRALLEEGRPEDRRREVLLLCNNIRFFHKIVNTPLSRFVVPSMKSFARAIGVDALIAQIDVGYRAAKAIDDVDAVCNDILARSNQHLDELFGLT
jgi:hypothetical protein